MTYKDHDDSIWVHERDYGGNPIGDFIGAFWNLGVAAVLIVLLVVRKISDRLS